MASLRFSRPFVLTLLGIGAWYCFFTSFPRVCALVSVMVLGVFFLYTVFTSIKEGSLFIKAGLNVTKYDRQQNPLTFWFYVFFMGAMGMGAVIAPIVYLINHR